MRLAAVTLIGVLAWTSPGGAMVQQDTRPRFQSRVTLVAVTAVVRKKNGQPVTGLRPDDFELYDNGERRAIAQFQSMASKISVALLLDFSGSMEVGAKMTAAHDAAQNLLSRLDAGSDEAGLFAFDSELHELQAIEPAPGAILARLDAARPYGVTSLYDAIAGAGRVLSDRGGPRRAIVALTDGADNSSRLTPSEVSRIASAIDVPVYVFVMVSPLDRSGASVLDEKALDATLQGPLGDLARWTGGDIFAIFSPATSMAAAGQVVSELRQQYLIAFPPGVTPGWHAIDVRTRQKNLIVRARSGYVVSSAADVH
jgi:VWFA-related protein